MIRKSLLRATWKHPRLANFLIRITPDDDLLDFVEQAHFGWFRRNHHPRTGLVYDRDRPTSPASIAATGFSLAIFPIACKRGWIRREEAAAYASKTLKTLISAPQGEAIDGTSGHLGMFYHFLDPETGTRAVAPKYWGSEVSTIDTALLMAGVLVAGQFFDGQNPDEWFIRDAAEKLYQRVEWDKFLSQDKLILHAWTPEKGMWQHVYKGYSEALLLYILALGSPTHPIPAESWQAFIGDAKESTDFGINHVAMHGMPLFCYQYPQAFIDFGGIADGVNRRFGYDYFENARRAALKHRLYAIQNPSGFRGYGHLDWGLTACDGPGASKSVDGKLVEFRWYSERGCPGGFDDGTIAPTAAVSSIAYVPEAVMPTIRHWLVARRELFDLDLGFVDAFNPTYLPSANSGWVDSDRIGIDQGPIVMMIENHRSRAIWQLTHSINHFRNGLKKAGFAGGWLQ